MNTPSVSIVMPVYNAEKFLAQSIDSILSQSFSDFEFLIFNDGSTDRCEEIVLSYSDERIRYFGDHVNKGYVVRLNEGIRAARGKYFARMDSDDIAAKDRLEVQIGLMEENPDISVCGSWYQLLSESGRKLEVIRKYSSDRLIRFKLLFSNPLCHPSVVIRREALEFIGSYDPEKQPAEDYDLWTKMANKYRFVNVPASLLMYRVHNQSVSSLFAPAQHAHAMASRSQYILKVTGLEIQDNLLSYFTSFEVKFFKGFTINEAENLLDRLTEIFVVPARSAERWLLNEEMSVYYWSLWRLKPASVRLLWKSIRHFMKSPPVHFGSAVFTENAVFLAHRHSMSAFGFALIAWVKNPFLRINYVPFFKLAKRSLGV